MVPTVVPGSDVPQMVEQAKETRLNFDELVSRLWRSGIVSGIESTSIKEIIEKGTTGVHTVASGKNSEPGVDANMKEEKKDMHKNRAPKESATGMFDFS
jgi:hypothetical protein